MFHILPSPFSSSNFLLLRNLCEGGEEATNKKKDMKLNVKNPFDFTISRVGIGVFPESLKNYSRCPTNSQLMCH